MTIEKSIEELKRGLERVTSFEEFRQLLAERGLDVSEVPAIKMHWDDGIRNTGRHPTKDMIPMIAVKLKESLGERGVVIDGGTTVM